jgi:hypothetical protein
VEVVTDLSLRGYPPHRTSALVDRVLSHEPRSLGRLPVSLERLRVGGVYGVNGGSVSSGSDPYASTGAVFDVSGGSNGSCAGSYLCTAGVGYDGPTGLGTPNGTAAF